jgi:soluble lytic murein transglycosylase-like protein
MLGGLSRILGHRAAGWAGCAVAAGLAGALAVTTAQARREATLLRGRIAELASDDASRAQAELVSCRAGLRSYAAALAASAARPPERARALAAADTQGDDPRAVAARLANTPPAGVDVCARMESADDAVLKTLDRR